MTPTNGTLTILLVFLAGCTTPVAKVPPPSHASRTQCMALAEAYRTHRWTPTARNIRHDFDANDISIDTPDISYNPGGDCVPGWWVAGRETEGVPYKWGGFDTIAQFDAGLRAGKAAGDVYTKAKREMLDRGASNVAVGIDCSGFISRCWNLPRSYSTRELPSLCDEISWGALKSGDILNVHNAHCLLFAGWNGSGHAQLLAYETGSPPTWRVLSHVIETKWLKSMGYRAWRYRGMSD